MKLQIVALAIFAFSGSALLGISVRDVELDLDQIRTGTLDLSSQGLTTLVGLDEIPSKASIRMIVLDNNELTRIPARIFDVFPNLQYLSLDGNRLDPYELEKLTYLSGRGVYLAFGRQRGVMMAKATDIDTATKVATAGKTPKKKNS